MNRIIACQGFTCGAWGLIVLIAAVTAVACGDVNVDLTRPFDLIDTGTGVGLRTLEITGSLTASQGACFEATVLYDGKELDGAGVVCPDKEGCPRLDLSAVTTTDSGRHTLSFRVLRQSRDTIDYQARVLIRITRDGLPFEIFLTPDPIRAALLAGEVVSFEFELLDWS